MHHRTQTVTFNTAWKQNFSLNIEPGTTWGGVKEQIIPLLVPINSEYIGFETHRYIYDNPANIRLSCGSKDLSDQTLVANDSAERLMVAVMIRDRRILVPIQITCLTDNIKFTTFTEYGKVEHTVGELKAKLSQFVALTCTHLYLKKIGVDEYCELADPSIIVPLKDVYATFSGQMQINKRSNALHLYEDTDGRMRAESNELDVEEERGDDRLQRPLFSKPKADTIVPLKSGQSLIEAVSTVSGARSSKNGTNPLLSNMLCYAACSGVMALTVQSIEYGLLASSADKTLRDVALITSISACLGAVIGTASQYVYDKYLKTQPNEQSHCRDQ